MMIGPKWIQVLVLLLLVIGSGCGGPKVNGKNQRQWLELLKRSQDPAELKQAANALAQMGPRADAAAYELVHLLADRQWFGHYRGLSPAQVDQVYAALAATVQAIGPGMAPVVRQFLQHNRPVSPELFAALSPETVLLLGQDLTHPDPKVRATLARLWAERGRESPALAPLLLPALADAEPTVRRAAARSLGMVATDLAAAQAALIPLLGDSSLWVRLASLEGLQALARPDPALLAALLPLLQDTEPLVRAATVELIGHCGPLAAPAVPVLVQALSDAAPEVQHKALVALGQIRPLQPAAAQALVARLGSAETALSAASLAVFEQLGPAAAPAIPELLRSMKQRGFRQNPAFAKAFGCMGPVAVPELMALLQYRVGDKPAGFDTNPEEGWTTRATAAEALGLLGTAATNAVPLLRELAANDRTPQVTLAAKNALGKIAP